MFYRGLFWIIEGELFSVKLPCDSNGDFLNEIPISLNGKENLTHSEEWNKLPHRITKGKPYNYYPRGRVEIKDGKGRIFLNPDVFQTTTLEAICKEFEMEKLMSIKPIIDGSAHYKHKLGSEL